MKSSESISSALGSQLQRANSFEKKLLSCAGQARSDGSQSLRTADRANLSRTLQAGQRGSHFRAGRNSRDGKASRYRNPEKSWRLDLQLSVPRRVAGVDYRQSA